MGVKKLKDILNPVSGELRELRSHDKHDHWMVQEIKFEQQDYVDATFVLIGCPQHEGVRRNNGRIGAAEAPDKIREQLYKLQVEEELPIEIFDAGNVITDFLDFTDGADSHDTDQKPDALEEIHNRLTKAVSEFLRDGKKVIVLGGGNDISYADVRALSEIEGEISAINMDAHLDMRNAEIMTSGTPYRKLIEDGYVTPDNLYEFGIRQESNGTFYLNSAHDLGVHIHYLPELIKKGVAESFQNILDEIGDQPFSLGLDMDSIQAADAPGVSASSPVGLSGREVLQCIQLAKQKDNLKVFEITEVNPKYDIDDRTMKLGAQLVYGFLFG